MMVWITSGGRNGPEGAELAYLSVSCNLQGILKENKGNPGVGGITVDFVFFSYLACFIGLMFYWMGNHV